MTKWNDYNNATPQGYEVIPSGTLAKVMITIKPGGYNDEEKGWTGGLATQSKTSDAVYLNCEFVVMAGQYAKRKIYSLIGLYSEKGETWADNGRSFIKGILDSAAGLESKDDSPAAQKARQINSFDDLEGLVFLARIGVEESKDGQKNNIKFAITAEHKEYEIYMSENAGFPAQNSPAPVASNSSLDNSGKPSWA